MAPVVSRWHSKVSDSARKLSALPYSSLLSGLLCCPLPPTPGRGAVRIPWDVSSGLPPKVSFLPSSTPPSEPTGCLGFSTPEFVVSPIYYVSDETETSASLSVFSYFAHLDFQKPFCVHQESRSTKIPSKSVRPCLVPSRSPTAQDSHFHLFEGEIWRICKFEEFAYFCFFIFSGRHHLCTSCWGGRIFLYHFSNHLLVFFWSPSTLFVLLS